MKGDASVQPYRWMIHDDISHMYHADTPTSGRRGGQERTGEEERRIGCVEALRW
jgi:hypothetical protein